jgi:hypothetical protein
MKPEPDPLKTVSSLLCVPCSAALASQSPHHRDHDHQVSIMPLLPPWLPALVSWGSTEPNRRGQAKPLPALLSAATRSLSFVCRPSSRALRLQVLLPMICGCAPLALFVCIADEHATLPVTSSRPSCRFARSCTCM